MKRTAFLTILLGLSSVLCAQVEITVDPAKGKSPISPYIYGVNQDIARNANVTARRLGGNRMTGYNWENNASNAGSDWQHSSDNYMADIYNVKNAEEPAGVISAFHDKSLTMNTYSLVTLQLAGYVARDKRGPVGADEKAPSDRWAQVVTAKAGTLSLDPDENDGFVYLDEEMNFLINKYGTSDGPTGIKGYSLDNEADLWGSTHPRLHPNKCGVEEYIQKSIDYSLVVKKFDPKSETFGPASYGFNGFTTWQNAPDWGKQAWTHDWFLAYYLDRMAQAEKEYGLRLLDVLDVHWYPEAQGGGKRIVFTNSGAAGAEARVQAPRSLWDREYTETSWISNTGWSPIYLIPRLKEMVDKYYPGTKIAFTEYEYGSGSHISGGVAEADVLGIFGSTGIYMANYWMAEWGLYTLSAFRIYRNYDGNNSAYGDTNVSAKSSDYSIMTTYASVESKDNSKLHLMLINKDMTNTQTARVAIAPKSIFKGYEVWGFDSTNDGRITKRGSGKIGKKNTISIELPPLSVYHLVATK
ncbi:MAG: glycoside hydrolase family 44 protein [Spirochaetia bacterium]|nr:glycoside hydrolase family 44 protein [Spirochaetia bacterium]